VAIPVLVDVDWVVPVVPVSSPPQPTGPAAIQSRDPKTAVATKAFFFIDVLLKAQERHAPGETPPERNLRGSMLVRAGRRRQAICPDRSQCIIPRNDRNVARLKVDPRPLEVSRFEMAREGSTSSARSTFPTGA
jgi:hypothetical protein